MRDYYYNRFTRLPGRGGLFDEPPASEQIQERLADTNLTHWGFVIFRCTYGSQEKWNKFLSIIKDSARKGLGDEPLWDSLTWTIFEDPEHLNGASMVDVSHRFAEWVKGTEEMRDTTIALDPEAMGDVHESASIGPWDIEDWPSYPRYLYFIYVDETSLESVVDETKAGLRGGIYFTLGRAPDLKY